MPLVFGLLVVLNAVFLAWQFFEQQNRGQNTIEIVDKQEGKAIQLLSERPDVIQSAKEVESTGIVDDSQSAKIAMRDQAACYRVCLLYTSPSPRDGLLSRMPSSA